MRWILPNDKKIWRNIEKYRVNWDSKERSIVQFKVKQFFKKYWSNQIIYSEMPIPQTRLKVDLINFSQKIAIETSGEFHFSYNSHFHSHSRSKFLQSITNDSKKRQLLELNNFKLIEIHEKEIPLLSTEFFKEKFDLVL